MEKEEPKLPAEDDGSVKIWFLFFFSFLLPLSGNLMFPDEFIEQPERRA